MLFQMSQNDRMRCYIDLLCNGAGFGKDVYILYLDLLRERERERDVYVLSFLL